MNISKLCFLLGPLNKYEEKQTSHTFQEIDSPSFVDYVVASYHFFQPGYLAASTILLVSKLSFSLSLLTCVALQKYKEHYFLVTVWADIFRALLLWWELDTWQVSVREPPGPPPPADVSTYWLLAKLSESKKLLQYIFSGRPHIFPSRSIHMNSHEFTSFWNPQLTCCQKWICNNIRWIFLSWVS